MNVKPAFLFIVLINVVNSSYSQTAFNYEGVFTRFTCDQVWNIDENPLEIEALNDSIIVIKDFAGIPDNFISDNQKDTILVKLDFENNTVVSVDDDYDVSYVVQGANLVYSISQGVIYEDSIEIEFLQLNPQGSQILCTKYKRGDYTSIDEQNGFSIDVNIYPNPTSENLVFKVPNLSSNDRLDNQLFVKLFNIQGVEIHQYEIDKSKLTHIIDVSDLVQGIYLFHLEDSRHIVLFKEKLIIE